MHTILVVVGSLWRWLTADNASRATAILVIVTVLYVILTWRMARAMARQTRAMVQPVVSLEFLWTQQDNCSPNSYFQIKNCGTQPLLLLDIKLTCHLHEPKRDFTDHYTIWDEQVLPPGEFISPEFDFTRTFTKEKLPWRTDFLSYLLEVVAADLSRQVILTYTNIPVLQIKTVRTGMPLSVRWRYFVKPLRQYYHRLVFRFSNRKR